VGAPEPAGPAQRGSSRRGWSPVDGWSANSDSGGVVVRNPTVGRESQSTIVPVAASGPPPTPRPPGRALLRVAGVLTQVACGACLLIGTIGLVLVEQNKTGGLPPVIAWLVTAMAGLVFGGLIYRGGLVSMLVAAAIDAGFGIVLVTFELDSLRRLLKILRASDVAAIHDALGVAGFAMLGAGAVCLVALPQGIRYARWFRDAAATRTAMSTARGFPPPPVPVRSSAYIIPGEDQPASRRRLYMALGGVAIGVGAGIGVLVSSTRSSGPAAPEPRAAAVAAPRPASTPPPATPRPATGAAAPGSASEPALDAGAAPGPRLDVRASTAARPDADRAAGTGSGRAATVAPIEPAAPVGTVQDLVLAQHAAIAAADRNALSGLIAAGGFGFGLDADELAEGRDAVAGQIVHDLGEPPPGGFSVGSRAIAIGEDRGHAWIAEQLEIAAAGREPRSVALGELAAVIDGRWQVVALHWATPVSDATAQRLAILSRLPVPARIPDRHDGGGGLDQAVRAAFASRAALAEAFSERADAFNYGSGGERGHGGVGIKRIFGKLRAEIRIHDGARVAAAGAWDPSQRAAPRIGWAALNVDFTTRTRAATDVTQTFRVLAILVQEPGGWKLVQTQWSNGGPVR
jgi:hypothetical protein